MIIRLLPEALRGKDNEAFLNVFRSSTNYENIRAYFFRSEKGIGVIINDNITAEKQAQAIMKIKRGIQKCKTAEMGVVDGQGTYHCGGSLCCGKNRIAVTESE